jgi:hypothetical protein
VKPSAEDLLVLCRREEAGSRSSDGTRWKRIEYRDGGGGLIWRCMVYRNPSGFVASKWEHARVGDWKVDRELSGAGRKKGRPGRENPDDEVPKGGTLKPTLMLAAMFEDLRDRLLAGEPMDAAFRDKMRRAQMARVCDMLASPFAAVVSQGMQRAAQLDKNGMARDEKDTGAEGAAQPSDADLRDALT